jgi:hypothetical protein
MADPIIHSEDWTGDADSRAGFRAWRPLGRLGESPTRGTVFAGAWCITGGLLFASARFSSWIIPAIPISVPPFWMFSYTSAIAFVLVIGARRRDLAGLTVWICKLAALALFAMSLILPPLSLYAYSKSYGGSKERMQLLSLGHANRGARFVFEDGRTIEAPRYWRGIYHRNGECFVARRFDGPFGFSWVKVLETPPPPQHGDLWWEISRQDCFSSKPLRSLGH